MNGEIRTIERCPDFWSLYDAYFRMLVKFEDTNHPEVVYAEHAMEDHVGLCKVCTTLSAGGTCSAADLKSEPHGVPSERSCAPSVRGENE
jgi:hypothetical protein